MALRQVLSKVSTLNDELNYIDYRIVQLELLGKAVIDNNIKAGDLIMETLPNNGARPIINPIYPPPQSNPLETIGEEPINPIGFQRMYVPTELKNSPMLTVFMEVDRTILLALVDTSITRLKQRKKQIFSQSREILKKPV